VAKEKKERNFCSKTEYLRPLLRVGGGIKIYRSEYTVTVRETVIMCSKTILQLEKHAVVSSCRPTLLMHSRTRQVGNTDFELLK